MLRRGQGFCRDSTRAQRGANQLRELPDQKNIDCEERRYSEDGNGRRHIAGSSFHHLNGAGNYAGETTQRDQDDQRAQDQNRFRKIDWWKVSGFSDSRAEIRTATIAVVQLDRVFGSARRTKHRRVNSKW